MFYRASDPTVSTYDWFRLNVDAIPASLVFRDETLSDDIDNGRISEIFGEGPAVPVWHIEPSEDDEQQGVPLYVEPDPSDYDSADGAFTDEGAAQYQEDLAAWKAYNEAAREEISAREERDFAPVWGWVWRPEDDSPDLRAAVFACGLRMYEHDGAGVLIGADSAGRSFHGAYWIPLRARLVLANEHIRPEDRAAIFAVLREEAKREGETRLLDSIIGEVAK